MGDFSLTNGSENARQVCMEQNKVGYWLNDDSTRATLHRDTCDYPIIYAIQKPDQWKWFDSKSKATASTVRQIHPCGCCNP